MELMQANPTFTNCSRTDRLMWLSLEENQPVCQNFFNCQVWQRQKQTDRKIMLDKIELFWVNMPYSYRDMIGWEFATFIAIGFF